MDKLAELTDEEKAAFDEVEKEPVFIPTRKSADFKEGDMERSAIFRSLVYKDLINISIKSDFKNEVLHWVFFSRKDLGRI